MRISDWSSDVCSSDLSDTIAGHTLGHYLSALSLMHAQTGDEQCRRRVDYIVDDLIEVQKAHGDGYVAGFTRKRGDIVEDGKLLFPERSEEHTSELQSLMRISYAVFCLKKNKRKTNK